VNHDHFDDTHGRTDSDIRVHGQGHGVNVGLVLVVYVTGNQLIKCSESVCIVRDLLV